LNKLRGEVEGGFLDRPPSPVQPQAAPPPAGLPPGAPGRSFAFKTTVEVRHSNAKVASGFLAGLGLNTNRTALEGELRKCLGAATAPDFYEAYESFGHLIGSESSAIFYEKPSQPEPDHQVYSLYNYHDTVIQDVRDLKSRAKRASRGIYRRYWVLPMPLRFKVRPQLSGVNFRREAWGRVATGSFRAYLLVVGSVVTWLSLIASGESLGGTRGREATTTLLVYFVVATAIYGLMLGYGLASRRYVIEINKPR
jgi:hypothetical protein